MYISTLCLLDANLAQAGVGVGFVGGIRFTYFKPYLFCLSSTLLYQTLSEQGRRKVQLIRIKITDDSSIMHSSLSLSMEENSDTDN